MDRLADRLGMPPTPRRAASRVWRFDEAASELIALIGKDADMVARVRAQQILAGLKSVMEERGAAGPAAVPKPVCYELADAELLDFGLWLSEELRGWKMNRRDLESCLKDWKESKPHDV